MLHVLRGPRGQLTTEKNIIFHKQFLLRVFTHQHRKQIKQLVPAVEAGSPRKLSWKLFRFQTFMLHEETDFSDFALYLYVYVFEKF